MADLELIATVPVLSVSDVRKSVAFYRDRLGFAPMFEFGPYAGVKRGPMELHLDGGTHAFSARPTCCRFHIRGVEALYEEMKKQDVIKPDEHLRSMHMKQFSVLDLDGNRITFAEPLS